MKIIFVCYANLCRSPLAEAIFDRLALNRGFHNEFETDSAGVAARAGLQPHHLARQVAAGRGIELKGASRALVAADFHEADEIVLMGQTIIRGLRRCEKVGGGKARLRFLPGLREVRDPFGDGLDGVERLADELEEACGRYLDEVEARWRRS